MLWGSAHFRKPSFVYNLYQFVTLPRLFFDCTIWRVLLTSFTLQSNNIAVTNGTFLPYWLVVSTHLKNISQLGWLFPTYGWIKMFQTTNQITSPIKTWRCSMDFPCRQLLHDTHRTSHQLDPPLSFWRIGHPSPASMVCNGLTWIIWGYPRDLTPKRMHIDGMDGIDGKFCARRDIARLKCSKGMHSFSPSTAIL